MNQIIITKQVNKLHKRFFKGQLIISVVALILLGFYSFKKWNQERQIEKVSQVMNQAFAVEVMYKAQKAQVEETEQNKYFGKIRIPKINLEYSVFCECNDELLKLLPCKFFGVDLGEKGNICIVGHNYKDTRFFSQLDQLKKGDKIYLSDLNGQEYRYVVYEQYKVNPEDMECLKPNRTYDLTLITCDNSNQRRWVVKASR